ncbi:MAG: hypothetical protein QOG90_2423 [Actinomycetota bacterium]|jgi:hypothetical protein
MTDEDPFDRAAAREQEIKHRLRLRAKRRDNVLHDGSLLFLGMWAALLAGHYFVFGGGAAFFVHASVFGLCVVMMLAPMLTFQALWAPFLIAHYHYAGFTTPFKLHLVAFVLCALPFVFISLPTRDDHDPLERGLSV